MLLIAIVDDERSDSSALKALVDTYFQQNRQAYMIHVFNGALDFIRSTENHDIVFMDIRMDKLDGLEVARIMCNRSYVVNLRYVSNINNDFLVVDGTQISISKSHRKEILQHFSNFLGENL